MLTPFQLKKQTHWFNVLDADRDGIVEKEDFEIIGDRIARAIGITPDSPYYDQMRASMLTMWDQMQPEVDENGDGHITLNHSQQA